MANKIFNHYSHLTGDPGFDLASAIAAGEVGVLLVMSGWVFSSFKDETNLAALSLGTFEYDGATYSRKTLVNPTWTKDATANKSRLKMDPTSWPTLGQGTNPAIGSILFWDDGLTANDALIVPMAFHDAGGFPKDGTGLEFRITWDASLGALSHGTA